MNKQDFISYTKNPQQLGQNEANELKALLVEYPYCTSAQILYAKALHNLGDVGYDDQLKRAASYAPNRKVLYQYLMQQKLIDVIEQVEESLEPARAETQAEAKPETTQEAETPRPDIAALEQEILREAISSSISLEVEEEVAREQTEAEEIATEEESKEEIRIDVKDGRLSFTQWLNPAGKAEAKSRRETFDDIIDQFIQADPKITAEKTEMFTPSNMAKMSLVEDEEFVTETLANIYVKQGNYEKARLAFERLRLQNPEKDAYFARLLKDLDGLEGNKE